jgi:hypothetical protein
MEARQTISEEYLRQQQELHKNPHYGVASIGFAPIVKSLMEQFGTRSLADYGAGKMNLKRKLDELGAKGYEYFPYDPAFPEYGKPTPADLVCCIDVLEHIEPEYVENVFLDLKAIIRKHGFVTIHTGAAVKHLDDGRNAHLIQQPASWWLPIVSRHLEVIHLQGSPGGFWMVVTPKAAAAPPS